MKNSEKFPFDSKLKVGRAIFYNQWRISDKIPWGNVMYLKGRYEEVVTAIKPRILAIENISGDMTPVLYAEMAGRDGIQRISDVRCDKYYLTKEDVIQNKPFDFFYTFSINKFLPEKTGCYVVSNGVVMETYAHFKRVWMDENGPHFEEDNSAGMQYDTKEDAQAALLERLKFVDFDTSDTEKLKSYAFTMSVVIKAKNYEEAKKIFDIQNSSKLTLK